MRAFKEELSNTFGNQSRRSQRTRTVEVRHVQGVRLELAQPHGSEGDAHSEGTWIFSFADLIMNLLMFFVMMFAISSVDKGKFSEIQQAFSTMQDTKIETKAKVQKGSGSESSYAASTGVATTKSKLTNKEILDSVKDLLAKVDTKKLDKSEKTKVVFEELSPLVQSLTKLVDTNLKKDPFSEGFEIVMTAERLFDSKGQVNMLSKDGTELLSKVAAELAKMPRPLAIWIQGFSKAKDGTEVKDGSEAKDRKEAKAGTAAKFPPSSHFQRSMEMANSVREQLEKSGLSPKKHSFSLGGFGDYGMFHDKTQEDRLSQKSRIVVKVTALPSEEKKK